MVEVVRKQRRFTARDQQHIAQFVVGEYERRKGLRKDRERIWRDIDRQLAMRPENAHKKDAAGNDDPNKAWMPELELPLQSQTLETLSADVSGLLFPASGPWFEAHTLITDKYLEHMEGRSLIPGDENDVPFLMTQDAADKLTQGLLNHWHRQYDFNKHVDLANVQALTYGLGAGRVREVTKDVVMHSARGVLKQTQKFPAFIPRSTWNVFPDDAPHHMMMEGHVISGVTLETRRVRLADLKVAASSSDDGWMPKNFEGIEPDKTGHVLVIEAEGDIVVPRSTTEPLILAKVLVDVVCSGGKGNAAERLVRIRFPDLPGSSYLFFEYHNERLDQPYPTSPLMKGWPIAKAAADAYNRLMMSAALNIEPVMQYDRNDMQFAEMGGPLIYPGAAWGTVGDVNVLQLGDPQVMLRVYIGLLQQYADVTGVNAPRLGAQTVSHTTAFAKQVEVNRGAARTVDYTRAVLEGPLERYLDLAYKIGRKGLRDTEMYIDAYGSFVSVSASDFPEKAVFQAHGAGGPAEEEAKRQRKLAAAQLAIQIDQVARSAGEQTNLDLNALIEATLREGGWTDVDVVLRREESIGGTEAEQGIPADLEEAGPAPGAALQAIAFGGSGGV